MSRAFFTDPKAFNPLLPPRQNNRTQPAEVGSKFDVVIVGSGFSGLVASIKLREKGYKIRCYEKGTDAGGTWYWNRYPGAACDVQSVYYSYSFDERLEQEWTWPKKYSAQPDILKYAQHVAARYECYEDTRFSTEVNSCKWNEDTCEWTIRTNKGDEVHCKHVVLANGSLSMPQVPRQCIEGGIAKFKGVVLHSSRWPEGEIGNLKGKRVAVVGTGATAVQIIPAIANEVQHLYVFQRTPATVSPRNNKVTDKAFEEKFKKTYVEARRKFNLGTDAYWKMINVKDNNDRVMKNLRNRIARTVKDPNVVKLLQPNYPFGCKRPCIHDDYFESFNLDNVTLVDVGSNNGLNLNGLNEFNENGPVVNGKTYPVDVIVFATGFDALGGSNFAACNVEANGIKLHQKWENNGRPTAFYGIHVSGFPNCYIMQGPHSPSVLSCMIYSSELQADHIVGAVSTCKNLSKGRIEVVEDAELEWVNNSERLGFNKVQSACQNWYNKDKGKGALQVYTGELEGYRKSLIHDVDVKFESGSYKLN